MRYTALIATALFSLTTVVSGADRDFASAAIKTKDGYVVVLNETGHSFSLQIVGTEVRSTSQERMFFAVDKRFLQVTATAIEQVNERLKDEGVPLVSVLEAHRDWEVAYMSKEYGEVLTMRSEVVKLPDGAQALSWEFDVPLSSKGNVRRQLYLTRYVGGYIISVGGVAVQDTDDEPVGELLYRVMTTLTDSDKPISLRKIQEQAKREAAIGTKG